MFNQEKMAETDVKNRNFDSDFAFRLFYTIKLFTVA